MESMERQKKNIGDKIKIISWILVLLAIFASVASTFYINRDEIYYFLRGETPEAKPTQKSPGATAEPSSAQNGQNTAATDAPKKNQTPTLSNNTPKSPEYLKNVIFLGDSIIAGFELCRDFTEINGEKILKDVTVVATPNYSLKNAVSAVEKNAVNLIFGGKAMKPEDIVSQMGEKYVFICLGLNDLSWDTIDEYIENYQRLVDNIKAKSPDKTIAILSVTPLVAGRSGGAMDNEVIAQANDRLTGFAFEENICFIDWAAAIRDENSDLRKGLSSDGYCHLKAEAYKSLLEYLLANPVE